jgi:hypothetical protein
VSGAIVTLILVSWVLSYRSTTPLTFNSHRLCRRFELRHLNGILFFSWLEIHPTANQGWQSANEGWYTTMAVELDSLVLGFGFYAAPGEPTRAGELAVPYWAIMLSVVVTAPGFVALRYVRRRRRQRSGHCPVCGYDLRATPERCPECGTPAGTPAAAGGSRRAQRQRAGGMA